jgi:hypothetical protein
LLDCRVGHFFPTLLTWAFIDKCLHDVLLSVLTDSPVESIPTRGEQPGPKVPL